MDLLPSPDSAGAQPGGNNGSRQVNHIYQDCKWNSPDRLRLEFWIEIGRIGYRIALLCEMKYRLAAPAAAASVAGTLLLGHQARNIVRPARSSDIDNV